MPEHDRDYPDKAYYPGRQVGRESFGAHPDLQGSMSFQPRLDFRKGDELTDPHWGKKVGPRLDPIRFSHPDGGPFGLSPADHRYMADNAIYHAATNAILDGRPLATALPDYDANASRIYRKGGKS